MTFDTNVRYRTDDLLLSDGSAGKSIIPPDAVLLEIKTDGAMPLFISFALSSLEIFPSSFSKYATAYRDMCTEEKQKIKERENTYA